MNEDYDTELHVRSGSFDDWFQYFRHRESDLEKKAIYGKRQRIFKAPGEERSCASYENNEKAKDDINKNETRVPFIPNFLYKYLDSTARKNIEKWRYLVDSGKTMTSEDLVAGNKHKKNNDDDYESSDTQSKNSKIKKGKKTRWLTNIVSSGLPDDTVVVKISSA